MKNKSLRQLFANLTEKDDFSGDDQHFAEEMEQIATYLINLTPSQIEMTMTRLIQYFIIWPPSTMTTHARLPQQVYRTPELYMH